MTSTVPRSVIIINPNWISQRDASQNPAKAAIKFDRMIPGFVTVIKSFQVPALSGGAGAAEASAADSEGAWYLK